MSSEEEYEILELIGRGSFGCVRKVRRIRDGKVSVKSLSVVMDLTNSINSFLCGKKSNMGI